MRIGVCYPVSARLDHARRDLDAMASAGASAVVLEASEEDAFEHPEHLAVVVAEARARRLVARVSPRGVLGLFAGGGASIAIGRDPSLRQRLSDGTFVPGACPNHPATGGWLERWLTAVLAARPDAVAWVEPRLWIPSRDRLNEARRDAWSCTCDDCRDAWAHGRHDAPGGPLPATFTSEARAFRRRSLVGLLEPSLARVHRDGAVDVITVAPVRGDDPEALPWEDLVASPYVDGLGVDLGGEAGRATTDAGYLVGRLAAAARGRVASHVRIRIDGVRPGSTAARLVSVVEAAGSAGIDEVVVRSWPDPPPTEAGGGAGRGVGGASATLPAAEAWRLVAAAAVAAG